MAELQPSRQSVSFSSRSQSTQPIRKKKAVPHTLSVSRFEISSAPRLRLPGGGEKTMERGSPWYRKCLDAMISVTTVAAWQEDLVVKPEDAAAASVDAGAGRKGTAVAPAGHAVKIKRWGELAIGVYVTPEREWEYYAFRPPPSPGDIVHLNTAIKLHLPGRRWEIVLSCFANSGDGRTLSKEDLYAKLFPRSGSRPSSRAMPGRNEESDWHEEGLSVRKIKYDKVRETMSDLSRILREQIKSGLMLPFQGKRAPTYLAAFTVGLIVKGDDGCLRFRPRS